MWKKYDFLWRWLNKKIHGKLDMNKYASLSTTYLILQIYTSSIGDKIHTKASALLTLCELRHAISNNEAVLHE